MHKCRDCRTSDLSRFYKDRSNVRGYQTYCKECSKKRKNKWLRTTAKGLEYAEKQKQITRDWYRKLRSKVTGAIILRLRAQVQKNNERAGKLKCFGRIKWQDWRSKVVDKNVCPGCEQSWALVGVPMIDHIKPLKLKGKNIIENVQPLCRYCNSRKSIKVRKFLERKKR